ncbi:mitochondrial potassium channel-like isoform X1 [Tachypleus tridentatus]|uniref:mitochondrial potassium channel-like isoform X1 n=1 Tax=Tachypleus tridentatus TaxID=6853 RepID=UPI003FD5F582
MVEKMSRLMKYYEDFIGLTEVKAAQDKVLQAERKFNDTQELRRDRQQQIQHIASCLKEIHAELDKTTSGEDRYLTLITQEHAIIKEERNLTEEFKQLEKNEREYFSALSLAVRESHEKEQAQAERMKYWSVIGSVCGAVIGILGTSINNWLRMKELRGLVQETADHSDLEKLFISLNDALKTLYAQVTGIIEDLKILLQHIKSSETSIKSEDGAGGGEIIGTHTDNMATRLYQILSVLQHQEKVPFEDIKEVKTLLAAHIGLKDFGGDTSPTAVYVGEDVEKLVKNTEKNLEWKIKMNSLTTVALVYGIFAITFPLITYFSK